jgi:hypothetical protein
MQCYVICVRDVCLVGMCQLRPCGTAGYYTVEDEEFEFMRRSNYPLRLHPSLMAEARRLAEWEGIALNQLFNVAVAEKLASLRTEEYLRERIRRAGGAELEQALVRAKIRNLPMERDALLPGGPSFAAQDKQVQPAPAPDSDPPGEPRKAFGWATPQFGKLKKRLERMRPR